MSLAGPPVERAAHAAALPLQGLGGQQAAQPLPHQARVHARLRHQPLEYQFYVGALELGCRLTRAANGRQVVLAGSRGPHSVPTNAATIMWPSCSGLSRFSSTALGGDAVLQDPAQVIGVGAVEGTPQARPWKSSSRSLAAPSRASSPSWRARSATRPSSRRPARSTGGWRAGFWQRGERERPRP